MTHVFCASVNKKVWKEFLIRPGIFTLSSGPRALKEAIILQDLSLCKGILRKHDPNDFIQQHINSTSLGASYKHEKERDAFNYQAVIMYEDVLNKVHDPQVQDVMHVF